MGRISKRKSAQRLSAANIRALKTVNNETIPLNKNIGCQTHKLEVDCTPIGPNKRLHHNITPTSKARLRLMQPTRETPEGRRIITLSALQSAMNWAAKHGNDCHDCEIEIIEEQRNGIESKLCVVCTQRPSKPVWIHNDIGNKSIPANSAFAWAANVTGIGYTGMKHALTTLDIPCMSFKSFKKEEDLFAKQLDEALRKQLLQNGREEYELAISKNQLITTPTGSIPWTSVYCDGQWSKRCYNQQGTALSGSAVLIGMLSKKPLFIGVRNKYCYACNANKSAGSIDDHDCFKNFDGSSSAMEADIVKEGFQQSVSAHSLIYKYLIGDGDSSVYLTVQNTYNKLEYDNTCHKG